MVLYPLMLTYIKKLDLMCVSMVQVNYKACLYRYVYNYWIENIALTYKPWVNCDRGVFREHHELESVCGYCGNRPLLYMPWILFANIYIYIYIYIYSPYIYIYIYIYIYVYIYIYIYVYIYIYIYIYETLHLILM